MRRGAALIGVLLLAAAPAAAVDEAFERDALAATPDLAYGEYLALECAGCHRLSGADDGIPGIVGWAPELFIHVMALYRGGERSHQVMEMVARNLDPEAAASLAAYFASLETE